MCTILYLFALSLFRNAIALKLPVAVIDNSVNITMYEELGTNESTYISWIFLLMILICIQATFIIVFSDSPLKWVGMPCFILYLLTIPYALRRSFKKIGRKICWRRWKIHLDSSVKTHLAKFCVISMSLFPCHL